MMKFGVFALIVALCGGVQASWYWPVGTDAVDEKPKRVSELIEPASTLIDEASDLAADGKTDEAVEKYRKALAELDRIELENPDRAKSPEFATLRNKRAYVNAAIDSMLLTQVKANARVVAVSDTGELEKRLDRERWGKRLDKVTELVDRRETEASLAELERAKAGTTNAVLLSVTYSVVAGVCCQKGSFGDARRALLRSRQELSRAGAMTDEEQRLVSDCLQGIRLRVVEGYGKALVAGRRACDAALRIETMDLSTTNAVGLAHEVVDSLGAVPKYLTVLDFPSARNLSRVSSNLLLRTSLLLERMESGRNPTWKVDVSGLESALESFGALSSEIKAFDAGLVPLLKKVGAEPSKPSKPSEPSQPPTKRERAMMAINKGDFAAAEKIVRELLAEKPDGALSLNLKAALETRQGKFAEAENTLDRAIRTNPRNHFAYYNMANLMLQVRPDDKSVARRYYEAGREFGGPVNKQLEESLK